MNLLRTSLAAACALCALSDVAHAADAVRLQRHESNGYFDKYGRFGVFYGMVTGDVPIGTREGPNVATKTYKRNGFGLDFDMFGFGDATRFDTLLGAEWLVKFGSYSAPTIEGEPNNAADGNKLMFRMDAAADYGLLHWDGNIRGRVSGGAGFGFDFDGGKWYATGGRAYAQLLGRVQLWSNGLGLHASYHWIPGTLSDALIREHRLEGAASVGSVQGGLRAIVTTVRPPGYTGAEPITAQEGQIFVAYAF